MHQQQVLRARKKKNRDDRQTTRACFTSRARGTEDADLCLITISQWKQTNKQTKKKKHHGDRLRSSAPPVRDGGSGGSVGEEGRYCVRGEGLTSGTQEAPAHVDGRGEEAVPLGAAVAAADHDVMGEHDAARCHAAVPRVIGHRTADTTHQTTWAHNHKAFLGKRPLKWHFFSWLKYIREMYFLNFLPTSLLKKKNTWIKSCPKQSFHVCLIIPAVKGNILFVNKFLTRFYK